MVYQWKTPIYKIDPNAAGAELEACRDHNGFIKPATVVERARSEDSPIHVCFEWSDEAAASRYREGQARVLMRNIVAVVESKDEKPLTVNAFVNIKGSDDRGYKGIIDVMQSPIDRSYLLQTAIGELNALRKKYLDLSELAEVFIALDHTIAAAQLG